MNQVLSTVELLENILLQLPMKDILLAQKVSRHFQTLITASPALQQALFFRPLQITCTEDASITIHRINPLLQERFLLWYGIDYGLQLINDIDDPPWNEWNETASIYFRKEASCHKMLMTQPPIQTLDIWQFTCDAHEHHKVIKGRVAFPLTDGLRMGSLYDHTGTASQLPKITLRQWLWALGSTFVYGDT